MTNKELLIRIDEKLDSHIENTRARDLLIQEELGKRPTRNELINWLVGAGVVSGMVFGIVQLI